MEVQLIIANCTTFSIDKLSFLRQKLSDKKNYRSGTVNSNMINSKFYLIQSFFEILARILSFHV